MAKIAELAGVGSDQSTFNVSDSLASNACLCSFSCQDTAMSYLSQWQTDAVASDNSHISFYYNDMNSNGLIYNLYADKLLQLNMVSDSVYDIATASYNNIASSATYGLALDSDDDQRTSISECVFSHWEWFFLGLTAFLRRDDVLSCNSIKYSNSGTDDLADQELRGK